MLNDAVIKRVTKAKTLGVLVDENLNWDEHFNSVKGKTCCGLASLKKLKDIIPQRKLCSVYYAIAKSHLPFANEVLGHPSKN